MRGVRDRSPVRHENVPVHRHRGEHAALGGAARGDGGRPRSPRRAAPGGRGASRRERRQDDRRRDAGVLRPTRGGARRRHRRPAGARRSPVAAVDGPLRVRMAIHSGSAEYRDGDFFGPALNRVARLLAIGHGGQVLVSGTTAALVADDLPPTSRADRPGRASPARPGPARARLPARRAGPAARVPAAPLRRRRTPRTCRPRSPRSWDASGSWPTSRGSSRRAAWSRSSAWVAPARRASRCRPPRIALDRYRDGAWLVELAPLSDPELVVAEIGRALGVQAQPGQPPIDTVVDYLRSKELLLLLDNCEHLIGSRRRRGAAPARQLSRSQRARDEPRAARRRWRGGLRRALAGAAGQIEEHDGHPRGRRRGARAGRPVGGGRAVRRARPGDPAVVRARSVERAPPSSRSAGGSTASRSPSSSRPPG